MKVSKIEYESLNNGPGVRIVVWCQGCSLHCPGCHNPESWDPEGGEYLTQFDVIDMFEKLEKPHIQGVTFSGGHPLESYNVRGVEHLIRAIKNKFPEKDVWLYTGKELTIEDMKSDDDIGACLQVCDVVVDGPYIEEQRDITLPYRGSKNQRIILVQESLKKNKIVIWSDI